MTDALKELIANDDWIGVAKAIAPVIDELEFRAYVHNRMEFPDVLPERWALIFRNVPAMEERYLRTFIEKLLEAAEEVPAKASPLPYDFTDNILRYMEGIGR